MTKQTNHIDFGHINAQAGQTAALDGHRFTSQEFMEREWQNIWSKSWLLAGMMVDIPETGDYFIFDMGRESIIVTRKQDGGVGAFFNVCQHRGNKIIVAERGSSDFITCPYHGWSYALDGTLQPVPDEDRFLQGVPCEDLSLTPVTVDVWAGLVWINLDAECGPLSDFLGSIMDEIDPYKVEDMILVKDQTVSLDANWKTIIDNFSELYHVDFIHPQHASFVDCRDDIVNLYPYGHTLVKVDGYVTNPRYPVPHEPNPLLHMQLTWLGMDPEEFNGRVPEIREAVQKVKRVVGEEVGFSYDGFTDDQVSDVWQYNLFPNLVWTIKPEELWVMRPRPHPKDPDKTLFDKWTLQINPQSSSATAKGLTLVGDATDAIAASEERPEREVFDQEDVIAGDYSMTITIDQDVHYLRDMQAGMHSQGFKAAWLGEDETRVQHFHDWVDVWVSGNPLAKGQKQRDAAE